MLVVAVALVLILAIVWLLRPKFEQVDYRNTVVWPIFSTRRSVLRIERQLEWAHWLSIVLYRRKAVGSKKGKVYSWTFGAGYGWMHYEFRNRRSGV